ncbi:MAG: hypothetical protein ACI9XK_001480 [Granulosicoccus sp.]|jgi:hypothetical protein
MTLTIFVINILVNHREKFTHEFPFVDTGTLISLGFLLLAYPVCFYIVGSYVWNKTEKSYHQQISEKPKQ